MSNLIESIVNNDLVKAKKIFESRINEIRDQKLYEEKRRIAADMDEAVGGMTKAEFEYKKNVLKYPKASDVLIDPRDVKIPLRGSSVKKVKKKSKVNEALTIGQAAKAIRKLSPDDKEMLKFGLKLRSLGKNMPKPEPKSKEPEAAETPKAPETPKDTSKSPGVIGRNINTLMGRQPGYVAPEKRPEEKGGTAGKIVRGTFRGVKRGLEMLGQTGGGVVEE